MDRKALLKQVYMFRAVTADDLAALLAISETRSYAPGDTIYRNGEPAKELFVIEMGTVDIGLPDRKVPIMTVGSGQVFGEITFLDRGERTAVASTREVTYLMRMPYDHLDTLLNERPGLALHFYRGMCTHLTRLLRHLVHDVSVDTIRRLL